MSMLRGETLHRSDIVAEDSEQFSKGKGPEQPGLVCLTNLSANQKNRDHTRAYDVDIVAIHGLNGTAFGTWTQERTDERTKQKSSIFWLKDLLPNDIPGARIFTYDYPSHVLFSKPKATIADYAQSLLFALANSRVGGEWRPLIFIAHSLGGIVCKEALIKAKEDSRFQDILESTVGVLFFGTPHRGARGTPDLSISLGDLLQTGLTASGTRSFLGGSRSDLFKNLKANSPDLRRVTVSFSHLCNKFQIVSIYETEEQVPLCRLVRLNAHSSDCLPF